MIDDLVTQDLLDALSQAGVESPSRDARKLAPNHPDVIVAQAELSGDCAALNRQQLEGLCARRGAELFIDTMAEWAG